QPLELSFNVDEWNGRLGDGLSNSLLRVVREGKLRRDARVRPLTCPECYTWSAFLRVDLVADCLRNVAVEEGRRHERGIDENCDRQQPDAEQESRDRDSARNGEVERPRCGVQCQLAGEEAPCDECPT